MQKEFLETCGLSREMWTCILLLLCLRCVFLEGANAPSQKDCKILRMKLFRNTILPRKGDGLDELADCTNRGWRHVPLDVFETSAPFINIGHNPFLCDCDMVWFIEAITDDHKKYLMLWNVRNMYCAGPNKLKGERLIDLWPDMICTATEETPTEPQVVTSWKQCYMSRIYETVDCSDFNMTFIPRDIFSATLEVLELGVNPYNCNCDMVWFLRKLRLKDFTHTIDDIDLMECATPRNLAGEKIEFLKEEDVCPKKKENNCEEHAHECHKNAECWNIDKGYSCVCKSGYTGDGKNCTDIDECFTANCPKHSICQNTNGSYECLCKVGFAKSGILCSDIDECSDKTANCHKDASCVNTIGSFKCVCKSGYKNYFNGRICVKQVIRTCKSKPSPCSDALEVCIDRTGEKLFECVCRQGLMRRSTYKRCEDINECATSNPCSGKAKCNNTFGSYECTCSKGYFKQGKHCFDVDECAIGKHDCHRDAVCVNNVGGYKCRCKAGFQQLKDGKLCLKEEKKTNTNFTMIAIISSILSLVFIALGVFLVTRKYRKKTTQTRLPKKGKLVTKPQPNKREEQVFVFNDALTEGNRIALEESNITVWSDDEDANESSDDDFDGN